MMKSLLIIPLILFATPACKKKGEAKKPVAPSLPENAMKSAPATPGDMMKAPRPLPPTGIMNKRPKEDAAEVRMLGPKDELSCENICLQLGYCQKSFRKRPVAKRHHTTCVARCKGERSIKGKSINKIQKECVDTFRGDNCQKLLECLKTRVMKLRKTLLSMKTPADVK